jgi:hypothetical protein
MFKEFRIIELIILIGLFAYFPVQSQNVTANAKCDLLVVKVGEQINLKLQVKCEPKTNIVWPAIPDSIGHLEIVSRTKIDTLDTLGSRIFKQAFVITCFDSGYYEIPPFTFMYEKNGSADLFPAQTQSIFLKFNTIPVDTQKPFKDIKGPIDEPITIWEYIWYIVGFMVLVVLCYLGWHFWNKRKIKDIYNLDYDPKIPPHVAALEALKQLDNEKLWQKGQVKLYHIKLTEIIRLYIERRLQIPALEMITEEIIDGLNKLNISNELILKMKQILELADLVKFAKHQPIPDENSLSMKTATEFVYQTIPVETLNPATKEEAVN